MDKVSRRDFVKASAAIPGLLLASAKSSGAAENKVRLGIVGTGNRGKSLLSTVLKVENVDIIALCDIEPTALNAAKEILAKNGRPEPATYSKNEHSFEKLMDREDIDAVLIATPWNWHTPMAVYAMNAGKYVGVEVPAALSLEECWQLVDTSEKTGMPCMMMENWSFRRDNLAVLNMIRQGLLGDIVHCHCAHSHDCIDHWFFDKETGADRWSAEFLLKYNRDQYPTHSLGPVYSWMDIGCGDYLDTLTSTATGSFGINDMFIRKFGKDHPGAKRTYAQGDIVTTVVKTKKGKSLVINYDMQLPRPYDNRWMIQGTRGIYSESRDSVYFVDHTPEYHKWEPFPPYQEKYEHKWWQQEFDGGHGGTDYLELSLLMNAVRTKTNPPLDAYDAAIMSCIIPLSGASIKAASAPVKVPDFTRGKWKTNELLFANV
jgi:hypothetical protein